jgi:hypothetical protein
VVASAEDAPTDQSYVVYEELARGIDAQLAVLSQSLGAELDAFNKLVRDKDVPAVIIKKK